VDGIVRKSYAPPVICNSEQLYGLLQQLRVSLDEGVKERRGVAIGTDR